MYSLSCCLEKILVAKPKEFLKALKQMTFKSEFYCAILETIAERTKFPFSYPICSCVIPSQI